MVLESERGPGPVAEALRLSYLRWGRVLEIACGRGCALVGLGWGEKGSLRGGGDGGVGGLADAGDAGELEDGHWEVVWERVCIMPNIIGAIWLIGFDGWLW